jgi:hypothetical protein
VRVLTFGGGPKAKGASDIRGASLLDLDDWERHGQSFARAALCTYPAILSPASGPA